MTSNPHRLTASPEGGARIQRARYDLGLTQEALARMVPSATGAGTVSLSTIQRWEAGDTLPEPPAARSLADALGWPTFSAGYLGTASPAREG